MKNIQTILVNAFVGIIIGLISLLPFLGWLYSGHGMVQYWWTEKFMVVGSIWGVICGMVFSLLPQTLKIPLSRRVMVGIAVGGFSGIVFYLIGDIAFNSNDGLWTIISRSLLGLVYGIIGGAVCALTLGIIYRLFEWIRINKGSKDSFNQSGKVHFKERILNAFIGFVTTMTTGWFLLTLVGQIILIRVGLIYLHMIIWFYPLPIVFGFITAIIVFIKPFRKELLEKSMDGLRNGISFSLLSVLYYIILIGMTLAFPLQKPEIFNTLSLTDFFLFIIIVFTVCFGIIEGMTTAVFEELFINLKNKLKSNSNKINN
jgi:hypothetical protein